MTKTIVIVIVIIIIAGLGYWLYQSTQTPEEKVIQNGGQTPREKGSVHDCGVSEILSTGVLEGSMMGEIIEEMENDSALACMGKNFLDNCKKSKSTIKRTDGTPLYYEISGTSLSNCVIRWEYPDIGKFVTDTDKKLANMYTECSFGEVAQCSNRETSDEAIIKESFGEAINYPANLFHQLMGGMMLFTALDPERASSECGCEGTVLEYIKTNPL